MSAGPVIPEPESAPAVEDPRAGPLRMYLITRRGALGLGDLEHACELAGAAAVDCVRRFADDERYEAAFAAWRERPRKVALRARGGQWAQALERSHALTGDLQGASVVALPPRGPSDRDELLGRMQALTTDLGSAPGGDHLVVAGSDAALVTYLINPSVTMSSGKTLAQVAHAAVMAADRPQLRGWAASGCPARVRVPGEECFRSLCSAPGAVARVVDAGLTEVAPGTVTVLALMTGAQGP